MPGKDGIQLANDIRHLRDAQSLPLILFSSSLRNEYGENQESLFAASIMKPLKQTQLYSTLLDVVAMAPSVRYKKITERKITEEKISGRYPLSILVAEDNIVNQKLAMRLLLKLGYEADIAGNGNIVLEMMAKKNYDIVFMDLHMPERDGLETTRSIVNSVPLPIRPKIIAMTADAMTGDREKCINAGMDDYISKPVRLEVLKTVLQSFGELILEHRAVFSDEKLESLIRHRTKELLDETDKEFILEFIGGFPGQAEESVGKLRTAVQEKNLGDAIFHAHKLRGLGLNFGGESLAAACREIEAIQSVSVLESSAPDLLKNIEVELHRTLSIIARVRGELL
jgi:CheY-like chemotaxis protein